MNERLRFFWLSKQSARDCFSLWTKKSKISIDRHRLMKNRPIIPTVWPSDEWLSSLVSPLVCRRKWLCSIYFGQLPCFPCDLTVGALDSLNPHSCTSLPDRCGLRCRCCLLQRIHCRRGGINGRSREEAWWTNRNKFEDSLHTLEQSAASSPLWQSTPLTGIIGIRR